MFSRLERVRKDEKYRYNPRDAVGAWCFPGWKGFGRMKSTDTISVMLFGARCFPDSERVQKDEKYRYNPRDAFVLWIHSVGSC